MSLDDRTADRQAHAHAAGFGGEEGIEEPIPVPGGDADAAVLTATSTCVSSCRDRITSSRGRSVTGCIASMLLMIRLMRTCWSWTRSPKTGGSAGASSVRSDTDGEQLMLHQAHHLADDSLMSRRFAVRGLVQSARTRRITSPARLPSLTIDRMARTSSRSAGHGRASAGMPRRW